MKDSKISNEIKINKLIKKYNNVKIYIVNDVFCRCHTQVPHNAKHMYKCSYDFKKKKINK